MREIDPAVLEACRRGDRAAFRVLVETYQGGVFAFASALVGADAADVTQETFVRAHAAVGRFDPAGPAKLSTWLLTITRRLCRDSARRSPAVHLTVALGGADQAEDPERRLMSARVAARVREAF